MAYWYACDVITTIPPSGGTSIKEVMGGIYPMLFIDIVETWIVKHNQSNATRNVTFAGLTQPDPGLGFAYETDTGNMEICLVRADEQIPRERLDEVNAIAGGGEFIIEINTVAKRNALYAAYPSLQGRFPDQP